MNVFVFNGQPSPATGMYVDDHGHVLFIRAKDLAPVCPLLGPVVVRWRLIRELPDTR